MNCIPARTVYTSLSPSLREVPLPEGEARATCKLKQFGKPKFALDLPGRAVDMEKPERKEFRSGGVGSFYGFRSGYEEGAVGSEACGVVEGGIDSDDIFPVGHVTAAVFVVALCQYRTIGA